MFAPTNTPATFTTFNLATNDRDYQSWEFATDAADYLVCDVPFPRNWNENTISVTFQWTSASGSTGGDVRWATAGRGLGDNDALDQALGTTIEVTDTFIVTNDVHTIRTGAITLAGATAGGFNQFEIARRPTDAADTLNRNIRLLSAIFHIGIDEATAE